MRRLRVEPRSIVLRWLDRGLMIFGIVCLLLYAAVRAHTAVYQNHAKAEIEKQVASRASITLPPELSVKPGDLIGRVDVPRLKLSAAVAEGDDDSTLGKAVGHLPDTPLPWQPSGNVAFAAHRDGLFHPLKDIRIGDEVRVVTERGDFAYRVRRTQIVGPDDVWVIAPTSRPTLTLITCYPFSFIGHAPRRFVVQADRQEADPAGVAIKGTVLQ
jgi:sortase A